MSTVMTMTDHPSDDSWYAWPSFTSPDPAYDHMLAEERAILQDIVKQYGQDSLKLAFKKVCKNLAERSAIKTEDIPVLDYDEVINKKLSKERLDRLREFGCFVVKGVVEEDKVKDMFKDVRNYVETNKGEIKGWPLDNPCILRLYWTELQIKMRAEPRHLALQKWVNSLWIDEDDKSEESQALIEPLTYVDAIRVRPAQTKMVGLGPHVDAGSLCRWADLKYRACYDAIFSGNPENQSMYDLTSRMDANTEMYPGTAHSSVFRAFQGWTALSNVGNQRGGLFLRPYMKETIAYILLRPFFKPTKKPEEEGYLDPDNWEFADIDEAWMPGTFPEKSQYLSSFSHPHLKLESTVVSIPDMKPGDSIWWHCDMIHAVDIDHHGDEYAGVVYVAAVPKIPINIKYITKQAEAARTLDIPPDFSLSVKGSEMRLKGAKSIAEVLKDNEAGLKALLLK